MALLTTALVAPSRAEDFDLEILTPHNEYIQQEFEQGFARHIGRPVKIRWIKQGTGQLMQVLDAKERGLNGKGSFGFDVFFGGGVPDHELAAQKGYLTKPDISAEILKGIPAEIAGIANIDDQGLWYGSALSSFGILVNKRGLQNQNLPMVERWADLADPRMYSWVVLCDPRKSASVRVSYELILQEYGWEKGWGMLLRIAGNARTFTSSSSAIPNEIATGNVLAGPCIDFYGYARVAEAGGDVLAFVNPKGGAAVTPDPISMLREPPHRKLAEQFIAFVLSTEGQALWALPVGAPDGPTTNALYRTPIRPDVFEKYGDKLLVSNPYKDAENGAFMHLDDKLQNERTTLVADLIGAACVDIHADLRRAWKALIDGGMKEGALSTFSEPPFSQSESLELAAKLNDGDRRSRRMVRDWVELFRRKYDRVESQAR